MPDSARNAERKGKAPDVYIFHDCNQGKEPEMIFAKPFSVMQTVERLQFPSLCSQKKNMTAPQKF